MREIIQDLRFAARTLVKSRSYTVLAIITIALGVGATTAVFSMVNGVLLRRLPYAGDARLVRLVQPSATAPDARFSVLEVNDYRTQVPEFAAVAEYHSMPFQLYGNGEPQRVVTGVVSDNFFSLLGVKPLLGRLFLPGEDVVGAQPVVVLDYRYWVDKMGANPKVVGSTFIMNDHVHTIVGVLPPLPTYPDANEIWMPAGACPFRSAAAMLNNRQGRMLQAFALLKPGVTLEAAERSQKLVANRLHLEYAADYPEARRLDVGMHTLRDELTQASRPLFLTLLATAAFVLLIATANFANLTLARQLRRRGELALRTALGAGRGRLFRQLATESLCVTLAGGGLGVLLAFSGLGLLRTFATRVTPRAGEITLDPVVLTVALAISIVVGLLVAFLPLFRSPVALSDALRQDALSTTGGKHDGRMRRVLVAAQVALAFVLLTSAGLMTRSLLKLQGVDGGYTTDRVMTARVDLNWSRYTSNDLVLQFTDALVGRLSTQPEIRSIALSSDFPLNNAATSNQPFSIRGRDVPVGQAQPASDVTSVSGSYFEVMGIPVMRGRVFNNGDHNAMSAPAVIAQRLVKAYWAGRDPIGEQISIDNGATWLTVVGIVGDVRQNNLSTEVSDEIYVPYAAFPTSDVRVIVRATAGLGAVGARIRTAVHEIDDKQPVVQIQTLDQLRGVRLSEPRVTTALVGLFAVLALVITAAGLAGLVGYSVTQRLREIGIRMALGATGAQVLRGLMRDGLDIVAAGLVAGLVVALTGRKLIAGLLYGISAGDPLTFVGVAGMLFGVAAVACYIPARRASTVDPVQTLRGR